MESEDNPLRIQTGSLCSFQRPTPLVLIHDSSGTTFSYFRLGSLNRDVWAIHDPHFDEGTPWKGGFGEIAEHYIKLIETAGIRGSILLGGWSLGGYLALTISHKLTAITNPTFSVAGILLVDSPYHTPMSKLPPHAPDPNFQHLPELVRKSFENYDVLLDKWELPPWTAPALEGKTIRCSAGGKTFMVANGRILYKPLGKGWEDVKMQSFEHGTSTLERCIELPPAALIRCAQAIPTDTDSKMPCFVDRFRHETLLGWDSNFPSFIKAAVDTNTHHFNIFDANINFIAQFKPLTIQLNECLEVLDSCCPMG
ncbi:Alpha/Beta hydrolase protein [Boeremia exigua]|uniref:Alpha/Beta hydrolase protein n=1 Tax=Boeremia exigua TaxID=749465 RepID=UPI001E8D2900|nr:Alpha/Beta hydrolase protein [Boeremia exigua]KAH6613208.1 Alpha/Beta hydrolase protein [Boeremia exigua]